MVSMHFLCVFNDNFALMPLFISVLTVLFSTGRKNKNFIFSFFGIIPATIFKITIRCGKMWNQGRCQEIQIKDLNLVFISLLGIRCSVSVFGVRCSMFGVRCSVFDVRCLHSTRRISGSAQCSRWEARLTSMFDVRCSVFGVRCSMFVILGSDRVKYW